LIIALIGNVSAIKPINSKGSFDSFIISNPNGFGTINMFSKKSDSKDLVIDNLNITLNAWKSEIPNHISLNYNSKLFEGDIPMTLVYTAEPQNGSAWFSFSDINLLSKDGDIISGGIEIYIIPGSGKTIYKYSNGTIISDFYEEPTYLQYRLSGILNEDSKSLSSLESWRQTLTNTINNILNRLTLSESRISALENQNNNKTLTNYFKYLSSSDRKNMVCGYAQDNHLTNINDLGFNCNVTYKQYKTIEKATCKCAGK
jgi:hypothetical protein